MTEERKPNPLKLIYDEAKGGHQTGQQLLPLLSLLEEPEGAGSLDEVKQLLTTIVQILGQHSQALAEIKALAGPAGKHPAA